MKRVFLVRTDEHNMDSTVNRLLGKMEFPDELDKPIGIKVNLCDYRHRETGVTTDPLVLESILHFLRLKYVPNRIYLFENDATGTLVDNLFPWLGLDKVARKYDVEIVNLNKEKWTQVSIKGYHFKQMEVPIVLLESYIINHPKMKTHGRTKVTLGLKNMYACYRIKEKVLYHSFLDQAIVDVNMAIKTDQVIVDGMLALEGNRGPTQGYPKKLGILVGGEDIIAVDAFCARLMGFNPRFVSHIKMAAKKKIGSLKYELESEMSEKELKGIDFEFSKKKFWLMQAMRKVLK